MGYGVAWINIQIIVQTIFELPWYYDTISEKLIVNPKRKLKFIRRLFKMPTWIIVSYIGLFTFVMCIIHLITILFRMNAGENVSVLEILFYCTTLIGTVLGLITIHSSEKDILRSYSSIDTISAILVEGNIRHIGLPTTERLPDIPELIGYGIMLIFICVPIIGSTWPLVLDVDPINRDLKGIIPEIPRRLLASITYGWVTYIAANACGLFLILMLTCCHVFEKLSKRNLKLSTRFLEIKSSNNIENMAKLFAKYILTVIEWIYPKWKTFNRSKIAKTHTRSAFRVCRMNNFSIRRHDHNRISLLMDQSNLNMAVFIPALAGVGITMCIVWNFGCISFYDREDLRVIWWAVLSMNLCTYYIIIFLCCHASKPLVFTEDTIRYWKGRLVEKIEKRQVRAMMSYGFRMGPFFKLKPITAFDIVDNIINQTISFLVASNS